MGVVQAIKKVIPTTIKQPVRDYLDASAWRNQPQLRFDASKLRKSRDIDLRSIWENDEIARAFATDHRDIARIYGAAEIPGGVNPGDRRAIYHLVASLRPNTVLEIGTHVGASTIYIAHALHRYTPGGRLTSCDIADVNAPDAAWHQLGLRHSPKEAAAQLGMTETVLFRQEPALRALSAGSKFDLIFLDGDHMNIAVYRELSNALMCLNEGGLILLHDFYPDQKPFVVNGSLAVGPAQAAERIRSETKQISFIPFGDLPWPTKDGTNRTSLALAAGT